MTPAVALFLAGVLMASTGQLLMKKGAMSGRERFIIWSFFNRFTIAGYVLMGASTVVSVIALKTLPLHLTVALLPLGYVIVTFLSVAVLRETVRPHHIWGMLLILTGIVIFNLGVL